MAVPKFFEFFNILLEAIQDGEPHPAKEVRAYIADNMHLSAADLSEMLPSGRQPTFQNRVGWAKTYLAHAGLIDTPSRGTYRITDAGKKALQSGKTIDLKYLEKIPSYQQFHGMASDDPTISDTQKDESPMELLDNAYRQITSSLASDLMTEIMKLTPSQFEQLVVKLLLRMGYGSGIDDAGFVTQSSNDGGIDGIIKEDQLGFSSIYIQAKQWQPNETVQRPEIQKFVGALQGQQAQKGLFITTAKFSAGATQYASNLLGATVVLVDGNALTRLMIRHNVGVSTEQSYEIKRLDSDFFTEEL